MAWIQASRSSTALLVVSLASGGASLAVAIALRRKSRRRSELEDLRDAGGDPKGNVVLQFSQAAVASHCQANDAWLMIDENVYDVTPWMDEHPGGKFLLLAFAGKDATDAFESIGHSATAKEHMQKLLKGRVQRGPPPGVGAAAVFTRAEREPTLTGGRTLSSGAVDERPSNQDGRLWAVEELGFLPRKDPISANALLDTPFEAFAELVEDLPTLVTTGELRTLVDTDGELQGRLCAAAGAVESLTEEEAERAFAVAGYIMVGYWRCGELSQYSGSPALSDKAEGGSCGKDDVPPAHLPKCIAEPLLALSKRLGRPPMVDYASSVLYNWTRLDPTGPISMSNVRCEVRLTGLLDEEWFFKTHVVVESEAAHVIAAVIGAMGAPDDSELLVHLVSLEDAMWRVVRACLPIMYERDVTGTPKCSPEIFYNVLRPLIKSGQLVFDVDPKPSTMMLHGPSGAMSALLPAIDAALGIKMTSDKLRQALDLFELSMPLKHREFLAGLRGRQSIRQRLEGAPAPGASGDHRSAAVRAFNRCISRVLDFRWQHWTYIKNFILKPGNISYGMGSGGTSFDYLQQHITDTERARLPERCEVTGAARSEASVILLPPLRVHTVPHHPSKEFWSVDNQHGMLSREPLMGPSARNWSEGLPPPVRRALQVLNALARRMPALCAASGPFRAAVDAQADQLAALHDDRLLLSMPEMAREHLMVTVCHIITGCMCRDGGREADAPKCLKRPLQVIARSVGRPPCLNFTELVLANWRLVHDEEPRGVGPDKNRSGDVHQFGKLGPLRVGWRFLACPGEEWYRAWQIQLHEQARDMISAIRVGQVAMHDQNDEAVVVSLKQIAAWLNKLCNIFDEYFERQDSVMEAVTFRRMQPFICQSIGCEISWEETACWVYLSGGSAILPALHAFLGVKMCVVRVPDNPEVDALAQHFRRLSESCRACMPMLHRVFIEELEKPGASLRQYCFRCFGTMTTSVEQLHDLEVAYNDSVGALVNYLERRRRLIARGFPHLAAHFDVYHGEIEESMHKSRMELLKMRQAIHRTLEK